MFITDQTSDETLALQALKGNQLAFKQLILRYGSLVYHFIYKKLQDRELSEDLTQEVFLKVHQALHSFDTKRAFKPWVLRIALHTVISQHRKTSVRPKVVSIHALQETDPHQDWVGDASTEPANCLESKILSESLKDAILQLEERYQETLYMRYVQDLSYAEIAKRKGVPVNTVKTWIKRGKEMLQKQMRGAHL